MNRLFEERIRFSQSKIWSLQARYFQEKGVSAWAGEVPHYATCNPTLARAYAQVIAAFAAGTAKNPGAHCYIVELGAGTGLFSFYLLGELLPLWQITTGGHTKFTYVVTDFVEDNLNFCRQHPKMADYIADGVLDFALFDANKPNHLHLRIADKTLDRTAHQDAMVLIANYFFDGLPTDLFYIRDGQLFEALVSMEIDEAEASQPIPDDDPAILPHLVLNHHLQEIEGNYYASDTYNEILEKYRNHLANTYVRFPVQALEVLEFFKNLAGEPFLLLAADKGHVLIRDLIQTRPPGFTVHGSLSVMVNFHAIGTYLKRHGGMALHGGRSHHNVAVEACLNTGDAAVRQQTTHAFQYWLERFGPDDFLALKHGLESQYLHIDLLLLLSWLRLTRGDCQILCQAIPALIPEIEAISLGERNDLVTLVEAAWLNHYELNPQDETASYFGTLLGALGEHRRALEFLEHATKNDPQNATIFAKMALCHYHLQDWPLALKHLKQSLSLDANNDIARKLRIDLESRGFIVH